MRLVSDKRHKIPYNAIDTRPLFVFPLSNSRIGVETLARPISPRTPFALPNHLGPIAERKGLLLQFDDYNRTIDSPKLYTLKSDDICFSKSQGWGVFSLHVLGDQLAIVWGDVQKIVPVYSQKWRYLSY